MNLHISLSPETEATLRQHAMAAGKDVDAFVLEAIERTLSTQETPTPNTHNDAEDDPFLGLLADEPELADFISHSAMRPRETRPLRLPEE